MEQDYDAKIRESAEAIFREMEPRVTPEDLTRIKAAFELAREAHRNQKRKTGEPYIIHPIAVARIVAEEMTLGANPVIAAFLHDVVEDTPYTLEDIEQRFGPDVAFLVRVVTKPERSQYVMSRQLDNFKQMLDSVRYDIRAILIKLADRLHNMRTLDSMTPDKQMKIAGETDYFYAPLANRLGLYTIKTELENLSFRYRCPHEYAAFVKMLDEEEEKERKAMDEFDSKITSILTAAGVKAQVVTEYRQPYSVLRKMRKKNVDFRHVDNKHFTSVVFPDNGARSEKNQCLLIYSLLTDHFKEKPGGVANYVDNPKGNGYQSFHVKLLSDHGRWEEVHICSERMVESSRLGCIASRSDGNVNLWLNRFRATLQDLANQGQNPADGFIEGVVTSFYNDDIMVFTPQGKSVILPKRATALDFAFEIHSKLGQHAKFARVNGKLCSIKTVLSRGDCVEIGADDDVKPRPEWQDCVITYKAKRFLRNYLAKVPTPPYSRCPDCNPIPGDEVVGFRDTEGHVTIHKRNCPTVIRLASKYGDSIVSVDFKERPDQLYPASVHITAVDRYHLLSDVIDCITNSLGLSIDSLHTVTEDCIVDCTIRFYIHSFSELHYIASHLYKIKGVEEVQESDSWAEAGK